MKYYAYGIVAADSNLPQTTGLSGAELHLFPFQKIALLVSYYEAQDDNPVLSSRKNLVAHQKVIEAMMQLHTVLPLKFGTVLTSETAQKMLEDRYDQFQNSLIEFADKVELNLKATWLDMAAVFAKLANEDTEIQSLKAAVAGLQGLNRQNGLIEIGKKVQEKLLDKKDEIALQFEQATEDVALKTQRGKVISDEIVLNLHFLVHKDQETALDAQIQKVSEGFVNELKFKYF
ncbi:MAG: GvpL/GvpF family gas vesicle protein, partial [Bacteroidota bacterium]